MDLDFFLKRKQKPFSPGDPMYFYGFSYHLYNGFYMPDELNRCIQNIPSWNSRIYILFKYMWHILQNISYIIPEGKSQQIKKD